MYVRPLNHDLSQNCFFENHLSDSSNGRCIHPYLGVRSILLTRDALRVQSVLFNVGRYREVPFRSSARDYSSPEGPDELWESPKHDYVYWYRYNTVDQGVSQQAE